MPDRYLYMMRAGLEEGFRVTPMADVRLYDRGAEGYLLDVGQVVYDIIGESHETAEYSTRQFGQVTQSELLYVPEIGALIPRPFIARHDAQLSDWLVSDHNWLTPELPSYHNQQFLWMSDVSPYVNATAQSKWSWPEGADYAFDLLLLPPVRCEFAPEKHEPFAFVTFGGNQWGLLFPAGGTTTLHRWVGDGWQEVAQLGGSSDNINFFDFTSAAAYQVIILNYRGRLVISTDAGQNWTAVEVEEEVLLPSGPMTCRFYGMAGGLILHQVKQYEGTYSPEPTVLFEDRSGTIAQNQCLAGRHYHLPVSYTGDEEDPHFVEIEQLSTWPAHGDWFAYRATLKPKVMTMPAAPFAFYDSPCLLAVQFGYPPVRTEFQPHSHVSLSDADLVLGLDVQKPQELDAGTASVELMLDPTVPLTGEYRLRYIEIDVGFRWHTGSFTLVPQLAGYVISARAQGEPGWRTAHKLTFDIVDASIVAKSAWGGTVDEGWMPLDGLTVNAALSYCAAKAGIPTSRIAWADDGGVTLAAGPADNPTWWRTAEAPLGTPVWDLMQAIAGLIGLEVYVSPTGVWSTTPREATTDIEHVFDFTGDYPAHAGRVECEAAALQPATAIIAAGEDEYGRQVAAWFIDWERERNPAVDLFAGRRQWRRLSGQRYDDFEAALRAANAAYDEAQEDHYYLYFSAALQPTALVRDLCRILGAEGDGVNPLASHMIESLQHVVTPHLEGSGTNIKARRL